ncbi:hypothetical protein ACFLWY_03890, partial [Chloroflexota bacterium]
TIDWDDQTWEQFTSGLAAASGIAITDDGTLYVSDDSGGKGVFRCLNPTTEDIDDAFFEQANSELTGTAQLVGLKAAGEGSLLARNAEAIARDELWSYRDILAQPVELTAPENGSGTDSLEEITLEWQEPAGAEEYELWYSTDENLKVDEKKETNIDDNWLRIKGLPGGEKYYWKVRVEDGKPVRSPWSQTWNFTVALEKVAEPPVWSPENGAQDVATTPSFGWNSVENATSYEVELARDAAFHDAVDIATTTINSYASNVTLDYATTYYWRVRALKDELVVSDWQTGVFTTVAKPLPAEPPVKVVPQPPPSPPAPSPVEPPPAEVPVHIWVWIGVSSILLITVLLLIKRLR